MLSSVFQESFGALSVFDLEAAIADIRVAASSFSELKNQTTAEGLESAVFLEELYFFGIDEESRSEVTNSLAK